jgi:predicted component of type VI protein secretion system
MVRPLLCCALLVLAACSKPQPPEKERPVDPQAKQAQSELGRAIQAPLDKAKGVDDQVEKGKEAQDAAIEAAGG